MGLHSRFSLTLTTTVNEGDVSAQQALAIALERQERERTQRARNVIAGEPQPINKFLARRRDGLTHSRYRPGIAGNWG